MIYLAIFVYAGCLFLIYKISRDFGDKSILGFRKLSFILVALEIPYLLSVIHNRDQLHPYVTSHINDFEFVFFKFLSLKILFLASFSVTAFHFKYRNHQATESTIKNKKTASFNLYFSVIMLTGTMFIFYLLTIDVGGLGNLLLSWSNKSEVLQGTAIYRISNLVFGLLSIGFYINFLSEKNKINFSERLFLILIVIFIFLTLLAVGERKNSILVIIYTMAAWNLRIKTIKIITSKNLILLAFLMIFSSLFPELRKSGAMDLIISNPSDVLLSSLDNWAQLFARMSDVETSLFIYSYFDDANKFWFGATWMDLITGLIPASLIQNKPPIDEGVYIYALAHYYDIFPPVPFNSLIPVGWPVSRVTGPYVHFGTIGVLFGGLITGWVMRIISMMTFRSKSPAMLLIYIWTMLTGFGLTNSFIFNLSSIIALLLPIHYIYIYRINRIKPTTLIKPKKQLSHNEIYVKTSF